MPTIHKQDDYKPFFFLSLSSSSTREYLNASDRVNLLSWALSSFLPSFLYKHPNSARISFKINKKILVPFLFLEGKKKEEKTKPYHPYYAPDENGYWWCLVFELRSVTPCKNLVNPRKLSFPSTSLIQSLSKGYAAGPTFISCMEECQWIVDEKADSKQNNVSTVKSPFLLPFLLFTFASSSTEVTRLPSCSKYSNAADAMCSQFSRASNWYILIAAAQNSSKSIFLYDNGSNLNAKKVTHYQNFFYYYFFLYWNIEREKKNRRKKSDE